MSKFIPSGRVGAGMPQDYDLGQRFSWLNDKYSFGFTDQEISESVAEFDSSDKQKDLYDLSSPRVNVEKAQVFPTLSGWFSSNPQETIVKIFSVLSRQLHDKGFALITDEFVPRDIFARMDADKGKEKAAKVYQRIESSYLAFPEYVVDLFSINGHFQKTHCGVKLLFWLLTHEEYLMEMNGKDKPFILAKDLLIKGQPILIRREGYTIRFLILPVYTSDRDKVTGFYPGIEETIVIPY